MSRLRRKVERWAEYTARRRSEEFGFSDERDYDVISDLILLAEVGKQQLIMLCPLGAIDTASGDGHKICVAFVEGSVFEEEQDVLLNPELQAPHRKQNALGFAVARPAPVFAEASRQRLFLVGGQL